MDTEFYLIDFENVQLQDLGSLSPGQSHIRVFLGQHQTRLPLELVKALRRFGSDADYIQINGSGPNALDFHIAFYLGRLAPEHPGARFTIISRDTGFDPVVRHLNALQIPCRRLSAIAGTSGGKTPAKAPATSATSGTAGKARRATNVSVVVAPAINVEAGQALAAEVVKRLKGMKAAKPAKLVTLQSSIASWFKPALKPEAVAALVQRLKDHKKISVTGAKVSYSLG